MEIDSPPSSPKLSFHSDQELYGVDSGTFVAHERDEAGMSTMLLVFIPVMVVILTVLLGLVCFLVAVLYMRRRKGIR